MTASSKTTTSQRSPAAPQRAPAQKPAAANHGAGDSAKVQALEGQVGFIHFFYMYVIFGDS